MTPTSMNFKLKKPKIALTYDHAGSLDSTGAQAQRILGLYAVCKRFKLPYVHSGISELLIQPLDPFQNEKDYNEYLDRVNLFFALPSDARVNLERPTSKMQSFTKLKLMKLRIRGKIHFGKRELVALGSPFQILNQMPNIYTLAVNDLKRIAPNPADKKKIILHYRRGSSTLDILPGEAAPRGLSNEWYLRTLRKYVEIYKDLGIDFSVEIYTDMPKSSFTYTPKDFQSHLWSFEPRFKDGAVEVFGEDLKSTVFDEFGDELIVYHGGDPLQGLIDMSEADILITSRSSYSYVGGLLNLSGKIIIPPGFWHRKLDSWVLEP
jgi:hypothetical protein